MQGQIPDARRNLDRGDFIPSKDKEPLESIGVCFGENNLPVNIYNRSAVGIY